jgi:hypothetical protein
MMGTRAEKASEAEQSTKQAELEALESRLLLSGTWSVAENLHIPQNEPSLVEVIPGEDMDAAHAVSWWNRGAGTPTHGPGGGVRFFPSWRWDAPQPGDDRAWLYDKADESIWWQSSFNTPSDTVQIQLIDCDANDGWVDVYVDGLLELSYHTARQQPTDMVLVGEGLSLQQHTVRIETRNGGGDVALDYVAIGQPLDYGDAADPSYPTYLASDGARHAIGGVWLGDSDGVNDLPDAEMDAQLYAGDGTHAPGLGDDYIGTYDDEDGVSFLTPLVAGEQATVQLDVGHVTGQGGYVSAWIDFDGDGTWTDAAPEKILDAQFFPVGTSTHTFTVPAGAFVGETYARFRVFSDDQPRLAPTGFAVHGEVEDYKVTLEPDSAKWTQPPADANPDNVYYGWNELSVYEMQLAADDWLCANDRPVTEITWWGSFIGWTGTDLPSPAPQGFHLGIWTDVPAGQTDPFSHPGQMIWENQCDTFTYEWVGWDYDPQLQAFESCFKFTQTLAQDEWFWQEQGTETIYWLSIAANYGPNPNPGDHPFGVKTRPRDQQSPAPDAAVRIFDPLAPVAGDVWVDGEPLIWDDTWWDLAFELGTLDDAQELLKWTQPPDTGMIGDEPTGMDVLAGPRYIGPGMFPLQPEDVYEKFLADDFLCTQTGPVTRIEVFASHLRDEPLDPDPMFNLAFYKDIPADQNPDGYSKPGELLWSEYLPPAHYDIVEEQVLEHFYDPNADQIIGQDTVVYRYTFLVPETVAFFQEEGNVYWLGVNHSYDFDNSGLVDESDLQYLWETDNLFGWKTTDLEHSWNDDAVYVDINTWMTDGRFAPPAGAPWRDMHYPHEHLWAGESIDLAFNLYTQSQVEAPKWSQPPEPYDVPDAYNGWDEYSVYDRHDIYDPGQIVADDWYCDTSDPVADVHWWGSFIGWGLEEPPEMPEAFHIGIWTDVPAGVDQPYSHPGVMIHEALAADFSWEFVGWDFDPRDPTAPPEATYYFSYDLPYDEWFWQEPGDNIYWVSISAVYPEGAEPMHPFGWKSRPRDPDSPAPDDAVRVFDPDAPLEGTAWQAGEPIYWPTVEESWDMSFVLTTKELEIDFGDAPDGPYPTLLASNGARHMIQRGMYLGAAIDAEPDGQPSLNADGDDLNPPMAIDDEDGVAAGPFVAGQTTNITITASQNGLVDAWIDFNGDGSWGGPGEQILASVPVMAGPNVFAVPVPFHAVGGPTYARYRYSSAGGLAPTGQAADGEVEDYLYEIVLPEPEADLGDAPDSTNNHGAPMTAYPGTPANYPTVFAAPTPAGPKHHNPQAVFLGQGVTGEVEADIGPDTDGVNNIDPPADIPDQDALDDGVQGPVTLTHGFGNTFNVAVTSSGVAVQQMYLNVWFDWDRDGDWDDAPALPDGSAVPEWAVQNQLVNIAGPGTIVLPTASFRAWHPGGNADNQPLWMRITLAEQRWSSWYGGAAGEGGSGPVAGYNYGETEDYFLVEWQQDEVDYGDAPDGPYPTMLASDGARHRRSHLILGNGFDGDGDGQPNAAATGDDTLDGNDDEDGVAFTSPMIPGQNAQLTVTASGAGLLAAWMDWNNDGLWAPGEEIFGGAGTPVVAGPNVLTFPVPAGATAADVHARFRLNPVAGPVVQPAGAVDGGEVEDDLVRHSSAPTSVDLQASSDTGQLASDEITRLNNAAPSDRLGFDVSGVAAGDTVRLFADGTMVGQAVAAGATVTVLTDGSTVLSEGSHLITATRTSSGELESTPSGALTIWVDTVAPSVSTPDLSAASDTGSSATDDVTQGVNPVFDGTSADAAGPFNSGVWKVDVDSDDGTSATQVPGTPTYSVTLSTLPEGGRTVTATAYDVAGNTTTSASLAVTVDRTAPTASTPDLDPSSDTGLSDSDDLTNAVNLLLTGSASDADSGVWKVDVVADDGPSATDSTSPFYQASLSGVSEGNRTISAKATDHAGNTHTSPSLAVTVDRTGPQITAFGLSSSSGSFVHGVVDSSVWAAAGRSEQTCPGSNVDLLVADFDEVVHAATSDLYVDGVLNGTATVSGLSGSGTSQITWQTSASLNRDRYTVQAYDTVEDTAGNALDGEPHGTTGLSFPTGNGAPGGDWVADLNVLYSDFSGDGSVDTTDLAILAANWKATPRDWLTGDASGDGSVDTTDLAILAANWKATLPSGSKSALGVLSTTETAPAPAWQAEPASPSTSTRPASPSPLRASTTPQPGAAEDVGQQAGDDLLALAARRRFKGRIAATPGRGAAHRLVPSPGQLLPQAPRLGARAVPVPGLQAPAHALQAVDRAGDEAAARDRLDVLFGEDDPLDVLAGL